MGSIMTEKSRRESIPMARQSTIAEALRAAKVELARLKKSNRASVEDIAHQRKICSELAFLRI